MCVIIYGPLKNLPEEVFKKCFQANPHGAGLAWRENKKIKFEKGFMKLEPLLEKIHRLPNTEMVVHFRLRSSGPAGPEMTHPFIIGKNPTPLKGVTELSVLFHNGTLSGFGSTTISDTAEFAQWLSEIPERHWVKILELTQDKFVLLSKSKTVLVGNFTTYKDCEFSNMAWNRNWTWNWSRPYKKGLL
ncbi:MAG: hypothetical protein QW304_08735 [Thermoproteota archaeon]